MAKKRVDFSCSPLAPKQPRARAARPRPCAPCSGLRRSIEWIFGGEILRRQPPNHFHSNRPVTPCPAQIWTGSHFFGQKWNKFAPRRVLPKVCNACAGRTGLAIWGDTCRSSDAALVEPRFTARRDATPGAGPPMSRSGQRARDDVGDIGRKLRLAGETAQSRLGLVAPAGLHASPSAEGGQQPRRDGRVVASRFATTSVMKS